MSTNVNIDATELRQAVRQLRLPTKAVVGGQSVPAKSHKTFVTENPATGSHLADVAECGPDDVDAAVRAAKSAFENKSWSGMRAAERKRALFNYADVIESHALELALLDCLDAGKPIDDCVKIDLPDVLNTIRWHAEAIDKIYDQVSPTGPLTQAKIVREPIGVVAAVLPWNFPAMMATWKMGPALATGCSVILKPAEQTSLSTLRLGELAAEAGLPDGVVNVIPGFGETAGQAIGLHPGIDAVSFTGSTAVGRLFLKYAADSNIKRIVLECGGKSPHVVMPDVKDLDNVARHAAFAAFWNAGQNCTCGSRLIVHLSLKDRLLDKICTASRGWLVGDPLDPATKIGAIISRSQLERIEHFVAIGQEEGARLVLGGKSLLHDTGGFFMEPTIFDGVRSDMRIAREEIFGPVLSILTFEEEAEAVAIANDTNYGLAASVYTDDLNTAHRISRALKAGTVGVNCYSEGDITTPFGGYKESGFGGRDRSLLAHDQYSEIKTIWMQM